MMRLAAAEPVHISSSPPIQSTQPRESNLSRTKSTRKSKPPPFEELPEVGEESDEVSDLLRQSNKPVTLSELLYEARWQTIRPKSRDIVAAEWRVSRTAVTAYYKGMKQSDRFVTDVDNELEYQSVVDRTLKWRQEGYTDLHINAITYWHQKDHIAIQQADNVAPIPPTPSQTPAPAYQSATARQLEVFATNAAELATKGLDKSLAIRQAWACTQSLCANATRWCWWTGTDDLRNHYPISTQIAKEWLQQIKAGKATVNSPGQHIQHQLMRARERLTAQERKNQFVQERPRSSSHNPVNNFYIGGKLLNHSVSEQLLEDRSHTASIDELPSSQTTATPSVTAFEAFFDWCNHRTEWQREDMELGLIKDTLALEGYDLSGLASMTPQDWSELALKKGYFQRVQKALKKYRMERRTNRERLSTEEVDGFEL